MLCKSKKTRKDRGNVFLIAREIEFRECKVHLLKGGRINALPKNQFSRESFESLDVLFVKNRFMHVMWSQKG